MIRTISINGHYHLSASNDQIVLKPLADGLREGLISCIDLGYLVLEHPHISITQHCIETLAKFNVAVIFVGMNYSPTSMLFHLDTHGVQAERFKHQLNCSQHLVKQLWAQTISSKIGNQAKLLNLIGEGANDIEWLAKNVKSGDPDNYEAQAARKYWPRLFGNGFIRERNGNPPNQLLNYGYTLLRAATCRALCGRGLYPLLGIHHHNRYNHFALADDMMEPFRPYVDWCIYEICQGQNAEPDITKEQKTIILKVLACDVFIEGRWTNLTHALELMSTSLARCFVGETKRLVLPEVKLPMGVEDDELN